MHLSPSTSDFLENRLSWRVHETSWNNFPSWFPRCHFDLDPTTSIFYIYIYIGASWGGGLRPPVFDLENRCQGGSAELYEGGYLTILEPPPFLFSSRACLSRQVFLRKQLSWQELCIPVVWACLQPFCMIFLSNNDFQQRVMNNIFRFPSLCHVAFLYIIFRANQQPPTNKQHNFTTLRLLFFVLWAVLGDYLGNICIFEKLDRKNETVRWVACWALEKGLQ